MDTFIGSFFGAAAGVTVVLTALWIKDQIDDLRAYKNARKETGNRNTTNSAL
jgi:hypothetical protein